MNRHAWMIPALLLGSFAHADTALRSFVDRTLNDVRTRSDLPAVAALVQVDGKVQAQAAVGVRGVGKLDRKSVV